MTDQSDSIHVAVESLQVGDALPARTWPPISETQLVRYAGASGDFNPIHTSNEFARSVGLGGVIAQGMLIMGLVGQTIARWFSIDRVRQFRVRFVGMTRLGDAITVSGRVAECYEDGGRRMVRCEVTAASQTGEPKAVGSFVVER